MSERQSAGRRRRGLSLSRILTVGAAWALACGAAPPLATASDPPRFSLSFDSEWIRLAIVDDSLEVRGTYDLTCFERSAGPVSLFYPFPEDSLLGGARMVAASASVDGGEPRSLRWEPSRAASGVRWNTPPCDGDTLTLETVYRQALLADYARYIVTTTKAWQRPLRRARFEIRLPEKATPVEFSYPFEARTDSAGVYYTYEAREFMPETDIVVRWRSAEDSASTARSP